MRTMVLEQTRTPLIMRERPTPEPKQGEILVEIAACGVCRTDLHVVDGELPNPKLPIVPGHEIVGRIAAIGSGVAGFAVGDRVGVPWLGFTCGVCAYCSAGQENLCDRPLFTGYTRDGGYATHTLAWHPLRWSTTGRRPILRRERPPKHRCIVIGKNGWASTRAYSSTREPVSAKRSGLPRRAAPPRETTSCSMQSCRRNPTRRQQSHSKAIRTCRSRSRR